ncbi:ArdC-like ssDNA-binding domain-containing protein [Crateriforma spongiae]|uniref:ArdC-like ssDNA-binding domain-containing protein n=1 Tax=Crateriforma spongiae TaxID=2724528 RepID=UPI001444C94F|nr:ArdC-like ssDNA-binding domain-containing protein [Crateriforma spongiae]
MDKETIKKLSQDGYAELLDALKHERTTEYTRHLKAVAKFHHYSERNALLIVKQMPAASHVAGYAAWRKLRRWVKKGESGIGIFD